MVNDTDKPVKVVAASGGLVKRETDGEPLLLIIHRSRYGDWTLPKGKVQAGESWKQCAIREVREETGFDVEIVSHAGWVCYDAGDITKIVRYWNMRPIGESHFQKSEEVMSIHWLSLGEVVKHLTYPDEVGLVRQFMEERTKVE